MTGRHPEFKAAVLHSDPTGPLVRSGKRPAGSGSCSPAERCVSQRSDHTIRSISFLATRLGDLVGACSFAKERHKYPETSWGIFAGERLTTDACVGRSVASRSFAMSAGTATPAPAMAAPATPMIGALASPAKLSPSPEYPPLNSPNNGAPSFVPAVKGSREPLVTEFVCDKCQYIVPRTELPSNQRDKKHGTLVEEVCMTNYKALARRWSGKAHLKAWWAAKSPEEQVAWYREHRGVQRSKGGAGTKRDIVVDYEEAELSYQGVECRRRVIYEPYHEWKLQFVVKGECGHGPTNSMYSLAFGAFLF